MPDHIRSSLEKLNIIIAKREIGDDDPGLKTPKEESSSQEFPDLEDRTVSNLQFEVFNEEKVSCP